MKPVSEKHGVNLSKGNISELIILLNSDEIVVNIEENLLNAFDSYVKRVKRMNRVRVYLFDFTLKGRVIRAVELQKRLRK